MTGCYDDGVLRAALDGALPPAEHTALASHLAACSACRARHEDLRIRAERAAALLDTPASDISAALATLRRGIASESSGRRVLPPARRIPFPGPVLPGSKPMSLKRSWRPWAAWAAGMMIIVALLALPPVRAAADQLLSVFRVQNVVFVPVNAERMEQLKRLNFDEQSLFLAAPQQTSGATEPRSVASLDEAAVAAGFTSAQPALPAPPATSRYTVTERSTFEFQVNVASARELLRLAGVDDVTLPDALGAAPIVADVPPVIAAEYAGSGYEVTLVQGLSPEVTLPDGVDLNQLGFAALRMLGMESRQATALASQIDWRTTLVFPFPADISNLRQVSIGGAPGLLVSGQGGAERHHHLYWQRGDRFFVMSGTGFGSESAFIALAETVR
ncbi:MAG: zf-HC2 domain-containing protein [Chloroflexi bacterium]|nr:zf-HC2 domain-containing protein [Chloroflexota bacterium]